MMNTVCFAMVKLMCLLATATDSSRSTTAPPAKPPARVGCEDVYDLFGPDVFYPLAYFHLMRQLVGQEMAPLDLEARQHHLAARRQYQICGGTRQLLAEWTYSRTGYLQHAVVYATRHDPRQQRQKLWEWRYTYPTASDSAFTVERIWYRYEGPDTVKYMRSTPGKLDVVVYWQWQVQAQRRPDGTPYRVALPVAYRSGRPPAGTKQPYQQAFLKDSLTSHPDELKQRVRFDGPGRRVVDQKFGGFENPMQVWETRSSEAYAANGKLCSAVVDYWHYSLAKEFITYSFDREELFTGYRVREFEAGPNRLGYVMCEFGSEYPCIVQSRHSEGYYDLPAYYALLCTYKTVYANGLARKIFVQDWHKQDERNALLAAMTQGRKRAHQLNEARAIELRYEYELFK